jgi:ABC-type bacteriocin/lantibiotic exporter with double-glycine peptidase domain
VEDSQRVDVMANAVLGQVLPSLVVSAALLGSLVFVDVRLLLILLAVIPILLVLSRLLAERVRQLVRRYQGSFDRFSSRILLNLRMATTIRAQVAESTEIEKGAAEIDELSRDGQRMAWLAQAQAAMQGATSAVAGMLVLVLGGLGVIANKLSIGDLLSFFTVLALVRGQATVAVSFFPQIVVGREALVRLERLLAIEEPEPYAGRRRIAFSGSLAVEDVSFGYQATRVVHELNLTIEPGEHVALKGPNGMGKSTLVALVLGLYRPDAGRLLADGRPYDELDVRELRRNMGILLQDPVLFRGSVRDNIAYGADSAGDDEVAAAARAATADEVIEQLPDGYRTEVGDDGGQISSGQRQRIAIARALMGKPPLIILDEPTSHLDEPTTVQLTRNLAALPWAPAVLLITHDPLVATSASRVLEMRDGRLMGDAASRELAQRA